ncbi:probable mitochondrial ribosomal protein S21 [Cyanidioschyzon merolae strain 10D]|jgi:ribosomal protein S21|uniref:Probable mitochondrial ribosomal protein S21 n=1 Tax=Cyanidioschyzon merolae (strain NIES-3377 / 10D) TaxID=280699 RepID=M1UWA2_CYAM1|nr:probable mitochondrial ribosomal protein S21 [Cyanidioschyzon merolae strain 10D]BAM82441.1 probable mitochondrial ribosomal protein S21 [Cyanidioschyzon merolae strain 10D]|eukprot:XP_005538477.1 probable mitochondrial ribosomal protein S21 [Cyanidioschyzon merolae strain 10D]
MALTVRVLKGHNELAFRLLKRKLADVGLTKELRRRLTYEKPSEKRRRIEHEEERRQARRALQHNLRFILSRMARGF